MEDKVPQINKTTKRAFDLVGAFVMLVIMSPIFLLIAMLLIIEHLLVGRPFDPLFYKDLRFSEGKGFILYKFNIFDQGEIDKLKSQDTFIHTKELERNNEIKKLGFLLKQVYLDELPQLINVLRGDMSIVGPRPLNLKVYERACKKGWCTQKFLKSGLTGNFQSQKSTKGARAPKLDREYLEKLSTYSPIKIIWLDLKIIARTLKVILLARGV